MGATAVPEEVARLGPWLHNLHLPGGVQTAPEHPLGDWPRRLWDGFRHAVPEDLSGATVLDVGCNAGFYAIEMARRGARVVGLEPNPRYRRQAAFAAAALGVADRLEVRDAQVYDLAASQERFDVVLFLGVLYHLRYPLLALDVLARACRGTMFVQSLLLPRREPAAPAPLPEEVEGDLRALHDPAWPKLAFLEDGLFGDATNRWVPNPQGLEAMLRSAGFDPEPLAAGHVYRCRRTGLLPAWEEAQFLSATGRLWRPEEGMFRVRDGTLETRRRAPAAPGA